MTVRKRKKKEKLRGKRTHGKGNTKNKRGAGCRGGRGRAGSHKHKYSKYYMDFRGKLKLKAKEKGEAINVGDLQAQLQKWVEEKNAEKGAAGIVVDGKKIGFNKVLGKGSIREKIIVRNAKISKNARKKIEEAGGKIEEKTEEGKGEKKVKGKEEVKGE